jgi:hypothetical protein
VWVLRVLCMAGSGCCGSVGDCGYGRCARTSNFVGLLRLCCLVMSGAATVVDNRPSSLRSVAGGTGRRRG